MGSVKLTFFLLLLHYNRVSALSEMCSEITQNTTMSESVESWLCGLNDWSKTMEEWKEIVEQACSEEDLGTEWEELFTCPTDPVDVMCVNKTAKSCGNGPLNCTICHCKDGKYENRQEYFRLWKSIQIRFKRTAEMYRERLQHCRQGITCPTNVTTPIPTTEPETTSTPTSESTTGPAINATPESSSRETIADTATGVATTLAATVAETTVNNSLMPSSCDDVGAHNGVIEIYRNGSTYEVYCDMVTDGGNWTVFQRRMDGSVDFYRDWEEYAEGFGNKSGEFWLGLEAVHQLTQGGAYELRVDLTDWDGSIPYANYGTFSISGRLDNYILTVGQYSGTAGDSLSEYNNLPFSAKNKDLDVLSGNCATDFQAAWWFYGCGYSSLNGRYNDISRDGRGVWWYHWKFRNPYSLKASEMKFRKK